VEAKAGRVLELCRQAYTPAVLAAAAGQLDSLAEVLRLLHAHSAQR
jgi:hypothetical protein